MNKRLYLFDSWTEVAFGFVVLATLYAVSLSNYLLFHSLAELFSVVVGFAAFVLVAGAQGRIQSAYIIILGTSFFFISAIDLLHTLAYKGMGVFTVDDANLPTQFWIAARYGEALAFLAAAFFRRSLVRFEYLFWVVLVVTGGVVLLVQTGHFPDCFVEGQGLTPFKIYSEYAICVMMLGAGALLWRMRGELGDKERRLIIASIGAGVLAELAFTFYVGVYDLSNLVGHFFKIVSFYFIYKAIVETGYGRPQALLFRKLAVSEANLRQSQRLMQMGSWEYAYDNGRMHWSDQLYGLLGIDRASHVEPSLELLEGVVYEEDRPQLHSALEDARIGRAPVVVEFRMRKGDAEDYRYFRLVAQTERDRFGNPLRLFGAVIDVTEQVQARLLREDVERITRHDLKTPLNSVIYLTMFLEDTELDAEQAEYVEHLRDSGYRALTLVNQSLDLYRMERGRYELDARTVDILVVLDRVRKDLEELRSMGDITLNVLLDGEAPTPEDHFEIQGDEFLCYTMLANIVRNALEAAPRGSVVTVDCQHGERLRIEVRNRGQVPAAIRDRFFEKDATFGKKGGSGLGTYSAKLIAEEQGGSIGFTTSEAEGTAVFVEFPA